MKSPMDACTTHAGHCERARAVRLTVAPAPPMDCTLTTGAPTAAAATATSGALNALIIAFLLVAVGGVWWK